MKTVEELREELKQAEKHEKQLDKERRESQSKAWEEIIKNPANYEWKVTKEIYHSFGNVKISGVRVLKRVKPEVIREWEKGGLPTFSSDYQKPDRWFGLFYYRTDENILTHNGGHSALKTPKICTDEQWESIMNGVIPEKFLP